MPPKLIERMRQTPETVIGSVSEDTKQARWRCRRVLQECATKRDRGVPERSHCTENEPGWRRWTHKLESWVCRIAKGHKTVSDFAKLQWRCKTGSVTTAGNRTKLEMMLLAKSLENRQGLVIERMTVKLANR